MTDRILSAITVGDIPTPDPVIKPTDPTPALGWRAMQTFACEVISAYEEHDQQLCCDGLECGCQGATIHQAIRHYIKAATGPTDAQALAEAMKLAAVQAVVKCLDREKSLIWIIENTVQVLIRNLALEMLGQQRAALKAWKDGQRQPTEYEQKLAAMKKDFPNGI